MSNSLLVIDIVAGSLFHALADMLVHKRDAKIVSVQVM
jgi:hypothetical protein